MCRYIKMEFDKLKIKKYIIPVIFILFGLLLLGVYLFFMVEEMRETTNLDLLQNASVVNEFSYEKSIEVIGVLSRFAVMILSTVLINKVVLNEYEKRTINIIYATPANISKVYRAKILLVLLISFILTFLTQLIIMTLSTLIAVWLNIIEMPASIVSMDLILKNIVYNNVCYAFIPFIPLFYSMKKKSNKINLVLGVLLTIITTTGFEQQVFNIPVLNLPVIPLIVGLIGVCSIVIASNVAKEYET